MEYRVTRDENGNYHWLYDLDMKKNNYMQTTVFRVMLIILVASYLLSILVFMFIGADPGAIRYFSMIFLLIAALMIPITYLATCFVARYYKGHFHYAYEMNEEGIIFRRVGEDAVRTAQIGEAAFWIGIFTSQPGLAGSGAYIAGNYDACSKFTRVFKIKAIPAKECIDLYSPFLLNQIFVNKEDYDFVLNFIESRTGKKVR